MTVWVFPQLLVEGRSSFFWPKLIYSEFAKVFKSVSVVMPDWTVYKPDVYFTNFDGSVINELKQMEEVYRLIRDGDALFFADLDFPGFSTVFAHLVKKRRRVKAYGYMHAGSYCKGDIFEGDVAKAIMEEAIPHVFDAIFVATNYHKEILMRHVKAGRIEVVGYPVMWRHYSKLDVTPWTERPFDLAFVNGRKQKGSDVFPMFVDHLTTVSKFTLGRTPSIVTTYNLVQGRDNVTVLDPGSYDKVIASSKIILSLAKEETFGVAVAEAVEAGAVPIVPDDFAYRELYPSEFRYSNLIDAINKVISVLESREKPPVPKPWRSYNTFRKIASIMEDDGVE